MLVVISIIKTPILIHIIKNKSYGDNKKKDVLLTGVFVLGSFVSVVVKQ